jgi:hypothetical protein
MWSWSGQHVWSYTERPSAVVSSSRHKLSRTDVAKSIAGTAHANTGCGMVWWWKGLWRWSRDKEGQIKLAAGFS